MNHFKSMRQTYRAGNSTSNRSQALNRDQVKGTAKAIAGKVQEKVGQVSGSTSQQVKGVVKQVEGKVQKGVGNVEQAAEKRTRP